MKIAKIYCLALPTVWEYLVSRKRLSMYPLDTKFSHAIRQIVDLAMDTFEERHLVVPALPESFSIDALPQAFEDDLRTFLKDCLTMEFHSMNVSYSNEKMTISLE